MSEVTRGDGWAVAPDLDSMGEGYGFRKLRRELDVTEFGVNVITIPPGYATGGHYHERQQELYFVHSGELEVEFADGAVHTLGPGGMARVDAATVRSMRNHGPADVVYMVVGAEGGYVGRDGQLPDGEHGRARPIASE